MIITNIDEIISLGFQPECESIYDARRSSFAWKGLYRYIVTCFYWTYLIKIDAKINFKGLRVHLIGVEREKGLKKNIL